MSRNRKPLAMQTRNMTVEEKIDKELQEGIVETGNEQLKKPPNWLIDSLAKKEFKRLVKEFEKIGIIGNLDLNNLCGYCNAYVFYRRATEELKEEALTVEKFNKNGDKVRVRNPLIDVQKIYAEEMRKFAGLCGLTIDSRLKAATVKISKEQDEIENEFGDI